MNHGSIKFVSDRFYDWELFRMLASLSAIGSVERDRSAELSFKSFVFDSPGGWSWIHDGDF